MNCIRAEGKASSWCLASAGLLITLLNLLTSKMEAGRPSDRHTASYARRQYQSPLRKYHISRKRIVLSHGVWTHVRCWRSISVHSHVKFVYHDQSRPRSAVLRWRFMGLWDMSLLWLPAASVPVLYNSPGRWPLSEWNGSWKVIFIVSFLVPEKRNDFFMISVTNHYNYTMGYFLFFMVWRIQLWKSFRGGQYICWKVTWDPQ